MKHSDLSKVLGAGILTLSMAILPIALPASAQSSNTTDPSNASPGDTAVYQDGSVDQGQRSFDWGWLGLLGLIGLAGRLANKRSETTYTEPNVEVRSRTDRY
jgi:hypothetical protein